MRRRVTDVIITHLHYDHVGGFDQFPTARFHVQDREVAFATGRHMTTPSQQHAFTPRHIADFVLAVHAGRVVFHDGDDELAPGLSGASPRRPHRRPAGRAGATPAADGWCWRPTPPTTTRTSRRRRPFPIVFDVDAMLAGFDRVRALADGPDMYVPGHDPEVLERLPAG